MSAKLGLIAVEGPRTPLFLPIHTQAAKEYSEETARLIDEEVKKILSEAHAKVREILASRRPALEELAKLLLEKEVVGRTELKAILKVRNIGSVKEKKGSSKTNGTDNVEGKIKRE